MDPFPFKQVDFRKIKALVAKNKGKSLLFSEGTYQVEMEDGQDTYWPFLQLDDGGKVLDCFCTCLDAEKTKACAHLGAGYLKIMGSTEEPLHVRFRESLWNILCQMASRRHGYEADVVRGNAEEGFKITFEGGKELFWVHPLTLKGKKRLGEIVLHRVKETEETSLKFSNLSQEELALWKGGRPSHHLQYELSFWSDLAKWWILLQEDKVPYTLTFVDGKGSFPHEIVFKFKDVEGGFYISEVNWPQIIPSLTTVHSPLPIHEIPHQDIEKITYDEENKVFSIEGTSHTILSEEAKPLEQGGWWYLPEKGFFPAYQDDLLKEKVIPTKKIPSFLHKHAKTIQKYLQGTSLSRERVDPKYHLFFKSNGDLVIETYLFEPGDVQKPHSFYFGPWVYLQEKGFYVLNPSFLQEKEKIIPRAKVSDFINRNRHWVSQHEGFEIHLSSLESHVVYQMTPEGNLRFDTEIDIQEDPELLLDVGEWIYFKGKGFYAKTSQRMAPLIKPGLVVPKEDVSTFIHVHREDLEQIEGFFSPSSPLLKTGLRVFLNGEQEITIEPEYHYHTEELKKEALLYGDYIYLPSRGFSAIPAPLKLPLEYREPKVIDTPSELYFITYEMEMLRPSISYLDPALIKPNTFDLKLVHLRKDEKSGGWLLELSYETEVGTITPYEIWKAKQERKWMLYSTAGLVLVEEPRFSWLKGVPAKRWLKGGKEVRLTTLEWLRLNVLETVAAPIDEESHLIWESLTHFQPAELPNLEGFNSQLRSYQEQGVRWLWFLYMQGLSGLLCDEMGLGKTHQAMGLIAAAINGSKTESVKILVVCPTSVIYHWEDLLKRFFPKIRVLVFYGISRTLEGEYDLLLTSYGTLRSESAALSEISFSIAIFDEIQTAKNPYSQTHKSLRKMDAQMRLGLTGTPIENRLLELKALFDLILPGYLPNEAQFKTLFVNPIEKYQDEEKQNLLLRFIRPFVLRRKKSEVLLELPEKIEEIAYCTLSEEQQTLYRNTLAISRTQLLEELRNDSKPVPFLHVFALLSTLKQICNHPTLINKDFANYKKYPSGKWDLFVELLTEARESGQKVVVFSQYLEMLDLIETHLKEEGVGFAGIRGSTTNRKEQVQRFKEDPLCMVFVASLQAAGVGIDLIAASVVIHYDRWWNPAKENQATDRVHRMGQSRGVQVFKLVTKHTIEEHIHRLIEKKTALAGMIAYDDKDQIKILDRSELIELLSELDEE